MTFVVVHRVSPPLVVRTFDAPDVIAAQLYAAWLVPKKFAREFQVLPMGQWEEQGK